MAIKTCLYCFRAPRRPPVRAGRGAGLPGAQSDVRGRRITRVAAGSRAAFTNSRKAG